MPSETTSPAPFDSAIGLPSSSTSAFSMLGLVTPCQVSRNLTLRQSRVTTTVFSSVNVSRIEYAPPTRPTPDFLPERPPNGSWLSQ